MREVAFDPFPTLPLHALAAITLNAPAVAVHRRLRRRFAIPVARPAIGLGNVAPYTHFCEFHSDIVAVIALVGYHLLNSTGIYFIGTLGSLLRGHAGHCDTGFDHGLLDCNTVCSRQMKMFIKARSAT